jgi:hypothetical protein
MTAPTITRVYPANSDTGIPINVPIEIDFSRAIDEESAKRYIALYGADFDKTSGPDSAMWINLKTGENPFFLRSPGFTGLVDLDYSFIYLNSSGEEIATPELEDSAAETLANYGMRVRLTPKKPLAPDVIYNLHIVGDPDDASVGIASRVIWSTIASGATDGLVHIHGAENFNDADTLRINITTGGDISTAKYSWEWVSQGVQTGQTNKITSRRYRFLDEQAGIQIRFSGAGFVEDDTYSTAFEPREYLATTTKVRFTTGDGTYTAAPASTSTPASAAPPTSAIPNSTTVEDSFYVVGMIPGDRSYNIDYKTRQIIIEFNEDVDPATVTNDTVTLTVYPALGERDGYAKRILSKKLTVEDNLIIIDF